MKSAYISLDKVCSERDVDDHIEPSSAARVIEFYEEAGADYEHWSKGFNMHLGFYRWGSNPFDREKMLEQLNLEVAARLHLDSKESAFLIDLGCGMGSIARSIARRYSNATVKGITIAPSQVKIASDLNSNENLHNQIEILRGDYTASPFDDGSADGVWAVESACYAEGAAKEDIIGEMARVLKTGGRFVVADCFLKGSEKELSPLVKGSYRAVCENWALSEMPVLDSFVEALKQNGFSDAVVEDISWRTVPSLAHAPFAVLTFLLKKLVWGERLKRHSINNLTASLLALVLGLNRSKFSYCIISGTRD